MSHTPWFGVATVLFWVKTKNKLEIKRCSILTIAHQRKPHEKIHKTPHEFQQPQDKEFYKTWKLTLPPYCSIGAGRTLPVSSVISLWTTIPNSFRYGSGPPTILLLFTWGQNKYWCHYTKASGDSALLVINSLSVEKDLFQPRQIFLNSSLGHAAQHHLL